MNEHNPYSAYTVETVLSSNPLGLVVALYEGAIDACKMARMHLAAGDILARTRGINKAVSILTELMSSLDHEKGGEMSRNLSQLYNYMQRKVIESHIQKTAAPLDEVEKLLTTMLEGWKTAGTTMTLQAQFSAPQPPAGKRESESAPAPYGGYMAEYADLYSRQAYSF